VKKIKNTYFFFFWGRGIIIFKNMFVNNKGHFGTRRLYIEVFHTNIQQLHYNNDFSSKKGFHHSGN